MGYGHFKEGKWVVKSEIALSATSLLLLSISRVELRGADGAMLGAASEDVSVAAVHHQHHKDTIPNL